MNAKQEMQLVRLGNKLLLLAVTPEGAETLTEITDPVEIDRLSELCQGSGANLANSLQQMLAGLQQEPADNQWTAAYQQVRTA